MDADYFICFPCDARVKRADGETHEQWFDRFFAAHKNCGVGSKEERNED